MTISHLQITCSHNGLEMGGLRITWETAREQIERDQFSHMGMNRSK